MVELETKITTTGVLYIPKEIREAFSRRLKIIPNAQAALFYPANASLPDVLRSLEIIKMDLEHRIQMSERRGEEPASASTPLTHPTEAEAREEHAHEP